MGCRCSQAVPDKQVNLEDEKNEDQDQSNRNINNPQMEEIIQAKASPPIEEKKEEPVEIENKNSNENDIKEEKPISPLAEIIPQREEPKIKKIKYDIKNYPKDVFELINKIRSNPKQFAEDVENAIKLIKEENGKIIYNGKLKVALNKGESVFREVINYLNTTPELEPFTFNKDILIECPTEEAEIKDPKVFQQKIINKKKEIELSAYFKDAIKDPYISTLLMIVDDSGINAGKKRDSVLSPFYKNIAISCVMVNKTFCAYFTFSK